MERGDSRNLSSLPTNRSLLLDAAAPCQFWNIVQNEFLLHVTIIVVLLLFVFSLLVNTYLLLGLESSEALSWPPRCMLLKNLIVSDLLQSVTLAPSVLYCLLRRQTLSFSFWCLAQFFSATLAIIVSLLTVASMALERFVYTCHGINYLTITTNVRMYVLVACIWAIGLTGGGTSSVLLLIGRAKFGHPIPGFVCEPGNVQDQTEKSEYFEFFNRVFVGFLLFFCLTVFFFSYGGMYQEARQALEPFQQDHIRARCTVTFYLGIFFLQLFPCTFKFIAMYEENLDIHLLQVVFVLIPPCANPLAYGVRNREVRQALKRLWLLILQSVETVGETYNCFDR